MLDPNELRQLFALALRLSPQEREAFVRARCAGRGEMIGVLLGMLREADGAHTQAQGEPASPGHTIGPYQLLEKLGEGGFGVVWLAERHAPMVQRVALKIIKPGMDSQAVIARFEQERQTLALMDHPNVARVFDGGVTPAGLPYFVMEYVRGEPITAYADRRTLTIRQRLELFIPVCEAVQHAHMKGVIHRDLKPTNILIEEIDGRAVAKVIDFGVAKAISHTDADATMFTQIGTIVGTPEYMSPEQAAGKGDIDTRTDVYSLGVMLYELLTGLLPFEPKQLRRAGYAEIQRIIREVEPPRPSTRLSVALSGLATRGVEPVADPGPESRIADNRCCEASELVSVLRRELEWVPLKAMRKDRDQRYRTPVELADDLRRYLSGRPLLAGPESSAYRVRKFIGRNRPTVAAAAAVLLALALGFGTALWQAREASRQRDAALLAQRHEQERADELERVSDFQASMLTSIEIPSAAVELTRDALQRLNAALERQGTPEPERRSEVDRFERVWARANAADAVKGVILSTILKPAAEAVSRDFGGDSLLGARLNQTLATSGSELGLFTFAEPLQRSALETRRNILGGRHPDTLESVNNAGYMFMNARRLQDAEPLLVTAVEGRREVLGNEHPDTLTSINNLGWVYRELKRHADAEPLWQEALSGRRRVLGDNHEETLISINNMAILLQDIGRFDEAEPLRFEALERSRRVLAESDAKALQYIANAAFFLESRGRLEEALPLSNEALEKRRRFLGNDHPQTLISFNNTGQLLRKMGRLHEAEQLLRLAAEGGARLLEPTNDLALTYALNHARLLHELARHEEAERVTAPRLAAARTAFETRNPARFAAFLTVLGRSRASQPFDPDRFGAADTELSEAHRVLERESGPTHPDSRAVAAFLASLHGQWESARPGDGHADEAARWRSAAAERAP